MYAYKNGKHHKYLLLFEMKTSKTPKTYHKAVKQLYKDRDYYTRFYSSAKVFMFYVTNSGIERVY